MLYPDYRLGVDVYQTLGAGFEGSVGYRRLGFDDAVNMYVPSLSKYAGNYLLTARAFFIPDAAGTSRSIHLSARRYLADGSSYMGFRYSKGSTREEIRDLNDVSVLDADALAAEGNLKLTPRIGVNVVAAYGQEERVARPETRRTSVNAGVAFRF